MNHYFLRRYTLSIFTATALMTLSASANTIINFGGDGYNDGNSPISYSRSQIRDTVGSDERTYIEFSTSSPLSPAIDGSYPHNPNNAPDPTFYGGASVYISGTGHDWGQDSNSSIRYNQLNIAPIGGNADINNADTYGAITLFWRPSQAFDIIDDDAFTINADARSLFANVYTRWLIEKDGQLYVSEETFQIGTIASTKTSTAITTTNWAPYEPTSTDLYDDSLSFSSLSLESITAAGIYAATSIDGFSGTGQSRVVLHEFSVQAIPEPSTTSAIVALLAGAYIMYRRRVRS